ncbi:hypothetical protein ACIP2Z_06410 [Streptomyces iakyrus]|uniref:Uncharacterized protein n=1 Tax=Streptomyces iakyrus TaxID=68219 RepID=A0ABW8F954_9ACTN
MDVSRPWITVVWVPPEISLWTSPEGEATSASARRRQISGAAAKSGS